MVTALVDMASRLILLLVVARCAAAIGPSSSSIHLPDPKAAKVNSFALFNSVHSAMRQFGSSVHHNDLSFYLAQAPEGSLFYHGSYRSDTPPGFDWLAFEFEHAQVFAQSWEPKEGSNVSSYHTDPLLQHRMLRHTSPVSRESDHLQGQASSQHPLTGVIGDKDNNSLGPGGSYSPDWSKPARGYFHTYIANRPLNLLYIGGESAAKCDLGPMDSQDLILVDGTRDGKKHPWGGEMARATELCALAKEWAFEAGGTIDGFVRMEAGFEIIYCDFFDGLDLLSVQGSPFRNETGIHIDPSEDIRLGIDSKTMDFEWLRAAAARFHGHPAGRLDIDWSSMVSAFAYPVNLSNPDWDRQDLPRVINATQEDRLNIRARLREVVVERGGRNTAEKGVVDWQGVVDRIVTRFSKRLWWMANTELSRNEFIAGLGTLIDQFIDYLDHSHRAEQLALDRCTQHYVDPHTLHAKTWTAEDHAIAAAISAVSKSICTSLFSAQETLRSNTTTNSDEPSATTKKARKIIQELISDLRWSTWRECEKCGLDEICSIPMFPVGSTEDYFHPRCKNLTGMLSSFGYWRFQ